MKSLNMTYGEAIRMWVTGSPPARFQHSGKENITDVLEECRANKEVCQRGPDTKTVDQDGAASV